MTRDPRIDPAPGDALCQAAGPCIATVGAVTAESVTVRIAWESGDALKEIARGEWTKAARHTVPLAEAIAETERRRAEEQRALEEAAERVADLDKRLAWLRGCAPQPEVYAAALAVIMREAGPDVAEDELVPADSLARLEVTLAVEEALGVEIPDADALGWTTPRELARAAERAMGARR